MYINRTFGYRQDNTALVSDKSKITSTSACARACVCVCVWRGGVGGTINILLFLQPPKIPRKLLSPRNVNSIYGCY